ncbi:MAG: hypothetical protein ACJA2Q_002791 [Pseudohongiellaceae bacterium]|jgi:hypothetical protein
MFAKMVMTVMVMWISAHSSAMVMLFVRTSMLVMFSVKSGVNCPERRRNDRSGGVCGNTYNSTRYLKWRFNHCNCGVYRNPDHCANAAGQCTGKNASGC